jgi:hypothetical protein
MLFILYRYWIEKSVSSNVGSKLFVVMAENSSDYFGSFLTGAVER